jgi:hypothetical protein
MARDDTALGEGDGELLAAMAMPPVVIIANVRATMAGPIFFTVRVIVI